MDRAELGARAAAGQIVGQGVPAAAKDVARVAGPVLTASTRLPADVVLRSGLTWPVLQHAAWLWRVSEPGDDPSVHWALSLQLRADLFGFLELALDAYDLGQSGAPVGRAYARVRDALASHCDDGDDLARLPPALPTDGALSEAAKHWSVDAIPGDLLIKCQLLVSVAYARLDGFSRREIVDLFAVVLDELTPLVMRVGSSASDAKPSS